MQRNVFPLIASGLGLLLSLLLVRSGALGGDGETLLPTLTLLFISEFGFVLTAAGAWVGGRVWLVERGQLGVLLASMGCLVLAVAFFYMGLGLWYGVAPA